MSSGTIYPYIQKNGLYGVTVSRLCGHTDHFDDAGDSKRAAWQHGYLELSDTCVECADDVPWWSQDAVSCDRCGLVGCGWSVGLSTQHKVMEVV